MTINCKDQYNDESFDEVCKALEDGNEVHIYIDDKKNERAETDKYVEALKKKYGNLLVPVRTMIFDDIYKLRGV